MRLGEHGTDPELWPIMMIPSAKAPVVVDSLTPGIVYAFQVRAFGRSDFNDAERFRHANGHLNPACRFWVSVVTSHPDLELDC